MEEDIARLVEKGILEDLEVGFANNRCHFQAELMAELKIF
jgi:hypothetical protein